MIISIILIEKNTLYKRQSIDTEGLKAEDIVGEEKTVWEHLNDLPFKIFFLKKSIKEKISKNIAESGISQALKYEYDYVFIF